jgi:hypothetical protein
MNFYGKLLAGYLLIYFDFFIETYDMIPDFIGYIIIVSGFMKVLHPLKTLGVISASILSIGSFIDQYTWITSPFDNPVMLSAGSSIVGIVLTIVTTGFYLLLIGLIIVITKDIFPYKSLLAPKTFFMFTLLIDLLLSFTMLSGEVVSEELTWLIVISGVIIQIWFFVFLWRQHQLQNTPLEQNEEGQESTI